MIQVGRRLIFEKLTGKIVMDMGEMAGEVLAREPLNELDYLDLAYGQDSDKFMRVKAYHVDTTTKQVIFDELYEPVVTPQQQIEDLQNQLLIAQGVI